MPKFRVEVPIEGIATYLIYATENGCRDEDCPGFKPNPEFPDAAMSAKTSGNPC